MKLLVIALLVVGIVLVMNGYLQKNLQCPPPQIVYKYIPRTLEEDQSNPVPVSTVFSGMFNDTGVHVYQS
jgi:hypothetical protein